MYKSLNYHSLQKRSPHYAVLMITQIMTSSSLFQPDVEAEASAYEDWLIELIEDNGIIVAPHPDVSAKELVSKCYEGAKPFKDGGEGHKDYLVWKTVATHINAQDTDASNFFLTNNTKDFCAKGDDGEFVLHPELVEQIDVEARVPSIQTALRNAFDNVLAPQLQGATLEDIPDIGTDEVQAFVDKCLLDDLPHHSAFGFEVTCAPSSLQLCAESLGLNL
ncbi:PIN domain-containing protein [Roseobacter litoralis]|uniref:DUF4935 domain-containing protein n=1 Tax=Roseobacter litoralis (strain ATCC 49566 / DSM 6996 / JCM 21268 / NBRC 15278 / OCh 149) TaxID=391595 RepID=F7ZBQ6_ROSLO|nr:PIN domain-containing protein [Roseobacter litoralis]AEI93098.1 hypothetical protein RLO149_c010910 [Roseobacter litoralis Och 149]